MITPIAVPHAAPQQTFGDLIHALVVGGPQTWWPLLGSLAQGALNLVIGAGMLLVTLWAADWASGLAKNATGRFHAQRPDAVLQGFVGSLVRYIVVIIGLIAVLQQIGVQTTSVLAVLGAASLAIGLALQGGLSNVAAGVMILLLRPYRIGDRVQIGGVVGKVRGLDLFVTRLHDLENSVVFIPNSKAFGADIIVNYSMPQSRGIGMDFGIDYADDVDLALELLIETAKADPRIVADPPPWAKLTKLGDSSVTVTLRAWTSPEGYIDTRFDLMKAVKAVFEREGLTFAYPQQVAIESRPWTPPDLERQRHARARRAPPAGDGKQRPTRRPSRADNELGSTSEAD